MNANKESREVVERHFRYMQAGQTAENDIVALFAPDGVYIEEVGDSRREVVGRESLRAWFRENCENRPPEFKLQLNRLDVDGDDLVAEWTCGSAIFESPARGRDRFTVREGQIVRLETGVVEMPRMIAGVA